MIGSAGSSSGHSFRSQFPLHRFQFSFFLLLSLQLALREHHGHTEDGSTGRSQVINGSMSRLSYLRLHLAQSLLRQIHEQLGAFGVHALILLHEGSRDL